MNNIERFIIAYIVVLFVGNIVLGTFFYFLVAR